ncbi:MAG: ABC transporter ATP-binding protein [Oscillospiraceae bacterium]|nr:ABC transporter ATP-binding protein [Oscillospiraceae bacterium]
MENIIEIKNITKCFPGIIANNNISLEIRRGEIYALLGENGAGKSTLMNLLFGLYEPDSGQIFLRGEPVNISSPAFASSLSIGMVHQHFRLVEEFTIAENIVLGTETIKRFLGILPYVDMKTVSKKISELSKSYGLDVDPDMKVSQASVSVRQRAEILKMLYREAEILIFDEPTAMLAPQEIDYLLQIMKNLREQGKTIILITHKLNEVKHIADRCGILNRGNLVGVYDVADTSVEKMAAYMVGRELEDEKPPSKHDFGEVILDVKNLSVSKQGTSCVNDVSFCVRAGEVFAVAGVDGNGQIELADAIFGLLEATGGSITLLGQDITNAATRERVETGMSYVPEDRHSVGLILDFLLQQNLALRRYYQKPFSKHGILNDSIFESFADGLIDKYDIRCGRGAVTVTRSMSGGNQQKAIVAREIEKDSKLMIFVQPTRGLDIGAIRAIHEHIMNVRAEGHAIFLISMELDEITVLADTIGVMYEGRINRIAPASELTTDEIGEYMMGVKT